MKQMITVATFNERRPAEALEERLKDKGIFAEMFDESSFQAAVFFERKPLAQFRVRVDKNDLDRTEKLFTEWSTGENPLAEAVTMLVGALFTFSVLEPDAVLYAADPANFAVRV